MSVLSEAIAFAELVGPLPRCIHGAALRDGGGESLEPPCGCRAYRTTELNPDTRRSPKTDRHCARCQKDIKPNSTTRGIHIVDGGGSILHPADERLYVSNGGDLGHFIVGMDCAKQIGMEWTYEA